MDQVALRADKREERGTRAARRMRRAGFVPAIVYGRDREPVSVMVADRDLYAALRTEAGLNALIALSVDSDDVLTVVREIQRHPVRGNIEHLDFIKVSLDEEIQADVSIEFLGTPIGVSEEGGVAETLVTTVAIRALPAEIPPSVELDIGELAIGDTLKISDLPIIEGVEYVEDGERPIVTILAPRAIEEEQPEEDLESLELAEGEEVAESEASEEDFDDAEDK